MNGNKILRMAMTTVIALGAAYGSFGHIVRLVSEHGQHGLSALIYPVVIDALMILSSLNLTAGRLNRMTKFWSRVGMAFGLACSISANLLSSDLTDTLTASIAVVPAVVLLITVEMLLHMTKGVQAGRKRQARPLASVSKISKSA